MTPAPLAEQVDVSTVSPGDEVMVGKLGLQVCSLVETYDDGDIVVTYFKRGQEGWENRARAVRGRLSRPILIEQQLRPMRLGEQLFVVRGHRERADAIREQMEHEQRERWATAEERQRRAAWHAEQRKASP